MNLVIMKTTKFVVKVIRVGSRVPEYVQRIDRTPIETTKNRKLALIMGRFTAEDAVKSMQNSRCNPELVSVEVALRLTNRLTTTRSDSGFAAKSLNEHLLV
jgi:hypothetical protein